MIDALVPIPKGMLFIISTGEYEDYSIHGLFRALVRIDVEALRAQWLATHPSQANEYCFDDQGFLTSLTSLNIMERVESMEWHLSNY